jgi:hypothetical protein
LLVLRLFLLAQGLLLVLCLAQVGLLANGRALVVTIFHLASLLGWLLLTKNNSAAATGVPRSAAALRRMTGDATKRRRNKKAARANPDG